MRRRRHRNRKGKENSDGTATTGAAPTHSGSPRCSLGRSPCRRPYRRSPYREITGAVPLISRHHRHASSSSCASPFPATCAEHQHLATKERTKSQKRLLLEVLCEPLRVRRALGQNARHMTRLFTPSTDLLRPPRMQWPDACRLLQDRVFLFDEGR